MLHRNTVIPIDAHDKAVRMLFFGQYFGHTDIVIKATKTGRVEAFVEGALDESELDPIFQYPVVEISPLEPGEYEIYSTNQNHTERSVGVKITLTGDSTYTTLERCSAASQAQAEDILKEEQLDLPKDLTALTYLYKVYKKSSTYSKKMALTKLLLAIVDVENKRIENTKLTVLDMLHDSAEDSVQTDIDCAHVIRRNLATGETHQYDLSFDDLKVKMPEEYESLYLYTEVDEDGLPLNFCLSYCPDPILYGFIKEDTDHARSLYERAVEKAVMYPEEYVQFEDDELPFLSIINEIQPDSPFLHAPRLYSAYGETHVEFPEEDLKILALFPDTFNLAINPIEYALDPEQRIKVRVPGKNFIFYSEQFYLTPGDYVCWIEDDYNHVVSDVKALRLDTNQVNPGYQVEEVSNSLNERIRKVNLYKYEKHLKAYAASRFSDVASLVNDALAYCEATETCNLSDIAGTIIDHCMLYENTLKLPDLITAVMQDKTVYGDYVVNFFKDPLRYKYDDFTLALPPDSNVLYRLERYSYKKERRVDYFAAKRLEATDFHFYDCDFAVFSAVDIRTGKSSGFLLFDFDYNREGRTKLTRFLLEAKEVEK